jgi:hypothetical protein
MRRKDDSGAVEPIRTHTSRVVGVVTVIIVGCLETCGERRRRLDLSRRQAFEPLRDLASLHNGHHQQLLERASVLGSKGRPKVGQRSGRQSLPRGKGNDVPKSR